MTNKEMSEIFSVMMLAYPNAELFKGDAEKLVPTIKLWTQCFHDVPFELMQKAVHGLIMSSPYPPTISEMTQKIKNVIGVPSPVQLWDELLKEVDNMIDRMYYFQFTYREVGELSTGDIARENAKRKYEEMRPLFKAYFGSFSSMLGYCRRIKDIPDSSLGYEQHRFDEFLKQYTERQTISELLLTAAPERKALE